MRRRRRKRTGEVRPRLQCLFREVVTRRTLLRPVAVGLRLHCRTHAASSQMEIVAVQGGGAKLALAALTARVGVSARRPSLWRSPDGGGGRSSRAPLPPRLSPFDAAVNAERCSTVHTLALPQSQIMPSTCCPPSLPRNCFSSFSLSFDVYHHTHAHETLHSFTRLPCTSLRMSAALQARSSSLPRTTAGCLLLTTLTRACLFSFDVCDLNPRRLPWPALPRSAHEAERRETTVVGTEERGDSALSPTTFRPPPSLTPPPPSPLPHTRTTDPFTSKTYNPTTTTKEVYVESHQHTPVHAASHH